MTTAPSTPQTPDIEGLQAALEAEDIDRAETIVQAMGRAIPPEALEPAADTHIYRSRWAEAARLLNRIIDPDPVCAMKQRLARNMAALAEHRPAVYRQVEPTIGSDRYQIVMAADGQPMVGRVDREWGETVVLTPGADPGNAVRRAMADLESAMPTREPIALLSLGDGYLLAHLASVGEDGPLGEQQPVVVFEADPALVGVCLMLHDYAGPRGPIRQARFMWHIGENCVNDFEAAMDANRQIALPLHRADFLGVGESTGEQLGVISQRYADALKARQASVKEAYAEISRAEFAAALGPNPPRKPRVLIPTTRFSTVLQYSARDAAAAFEELGWDVKLLIEDAAHTRLVPAAVLAAVDEFRPDLVLQIDHLRDAFTDIYPANLPVACWAQDHLPHLTRKEAGRSITKRDFVLTGARPMYTGQYAYPERQCIPLTKLTRPVALPASWRSDGDDLVYVSHASAKPEDLVEELVEEAASSATAEELVRTTCGRIQNVYERGGSLSTADDVAAELDAVIAEASWTLADAARASLLRWLVHPFNDCLYRQQALRWAADTAEDMGLTLAIYGKHWDKNPQFAAHARGVIRYGPDLEELTRRSRINLQIMPNCCLHQRLLDGVIAGGFFLIRRNTVDMLLGELSRFVADRLPPDVTDAETAREVVEPAHREALETFIERGRKLSVFGEPTDAIAMICSLREANYVTEDHQLLPGMHEVAFDDAASLRAAIERFIDDEGRRREMSKAQRSSIQQRLTYRAGMQRVAARIGRLIGEEG